MKRRKFRRKLVEAIANRKNRPLLYGVLFLIAAAATALACGWGSYDDHSVRFNYYRTGRAFYRLPPLPLMYDTKTGKEVTAHEVANYLYPENPDIESFDEPSGSSESEPTKVWKQALSAIQQEDLANARELLKRFLDVSALPDFYEEPETQKDRNTAVDILDGISAIKRGSKPRAVQEYIDARLAYNTNSTEISEQPIAESDRNLRDNWSYLRAATLYSTNHKEAALAAFREHTERHPNSEKNEAVRYMIAKIIMESSHSFGNMSCGIMGKRQWENEEIKTSEIEPVEKCKDESWHKAVEAFREMMQKFPNGRYRNDARGWLAYLYRRGGDRAEALAEYYRLLGDPTERTARLEAKKSLQFIGHEYDDQMLDKVESLIVGDRDAALAYAYHRIYNHAIDFSYEEPSKWCCSGEDSWREREEEETRVSKANRIGNHELERIAKFASAMMNRYSSAAVSGNFVLRVAEAQLELQNYAEALKSADKALELGISGDMRMEGLWVKGSSEHKQKRLKAARETFKKLIAEFPKTKLTEGARRLLAMTAEDQDDLETALDLYTELDYESDVAYLVDVLLPTDRLAKYAEDRKRTPQYDRLLYSLGLRYMRDKRWKDARDTFHRVRTETGTDGYLQQDKNATWYFPKEPGFDEGEFSYIKTSWVTQDLKTIDILESHEQAVESAQGDEAKAEAMYQLASVLFEADDLAFYNPSLWTGWRSGRLNDLQFSDHERLPNESRIIFEHLNSHDPWARAIPIYEDIVSRFPKTKTARDAMYSTAVAHERLAGRIYPWSTIYQRGLFAGSRMITYADVKNAYPDYQLPRGTYGWEPSTRTVNGGPGWAPKPRPAPPLTRTQRFERRVKYAYDKFQLFVKPKIDAVTSWVGDGVNGYLSVINACLSWLLWIVCVLGTGYAALVGYHFRGPLLAAARRLGGAEISTEQPLEKLPATDSRVEKVIDEAHSDEVSQL